MGGGVKGLVTRIMLIITENLFFFHFWCEIGSDVCQLPFLTFISLVFGDMSLSLSLIMMCSSF